MKKRKGLYIIFSGILILTILLGAFIGLRSKSKKDIQELSKKKMIEDFNYLFDCVIDNYPYLGVNERLNGVNFKENKDKYLDMINNCENYSEFELAIRNITKDLNNSHTYILDKETVKQFRSLYTSIESGTWYELNRKVLNNEKAIKRYGLTKEVEKVKKKDSKLYAEPKVKDIVSGEIGYIELPLMNDRTYREKDMKYISDYLDKVKNYKALVIDIRGNRGGDSTYWKEIFSNMISHNYYTDYYYFYKDGDLINNFLEYVEMDIESIPKVKDLKEKLINLPPEVYKDFKSYWKSEYSVIKSNRSINFQGNIYLLVDDKVFSSAEALAVFAKDTKMATLIGSRTKGDGIGSDPMMTMLPNSGLIFNFTKGMGTLKDGTCNEEHKTVPDIVIENTKKTNDFKTDECIKKVLELEQLKIN